MWVLSARINLDNTMESAVQPKVGIAGGPSEAWHIAQTTAKSGLKTLSAGVNDDKAIKSRRPERSL
ncbi:MAG: hypothetical protein AB1555_18390, partial [Nitrospirota bacterium]